MALTVATWNVENLFRPGTPGGPSDPAVYEAKLTGLAATIGALAPDVLALQEIGQPEALDDLRGHLGGGWHSALSPDPDARGIRVGFLARLPLGAVEPVRAFPPPLAPSRWPTTAPRSTRWGAGRCACRSRPAAATST
jgi:hypothetical protein